jgi:hypothetical protein
MKIYLETLNKDVTKELAAALERKILRMSEEMKVHENWRK